LYRALDLRAADLTLPHTLASVDFVIASLIGHRQSLLYRRQGSRLAEDVCIGRPFFDERAEKAEWYRRIIRP